MVEVFTERGKEFRFGDHVYAEMIMAPEDQRSGLLIQVRKGAGQFRSTMWLVRLRGGQLMRFENVMMRKVDDEEFIDAFYTSNGAEPPKIEPQEMIEDDWDGVECTLNGEYPESGFIVENPTNPLTPGHLAMTITKEKDQGDQHG